MVSRRKLLVGCAALFSLAGCSEPERTETTTLTETATRTPSPTQSPTETEVSSETPSVGQSEVALAEIESKLVVETNEFSKEGEIDQRPLTAPISDAGTNDRLYEVRAIRRDIDTNDLTNAQRARFDRLESAYWFLWWVELTHNAAVNLIDSGPESWARVRGSEPTRAPVQPLEGALSGPPKWLADLEADSDESGLGELPGYSREDYDQVISRYEEVVAQGKLFIEQVRLHQEANRRWESEYYESAELEYRSNLESYNAQDWIVHFQPIIDEMICFAQARADRSEAFYRAQRLEEEGETEAAEIERELAPPEPSEVCDFANTPSSF